MDTSGLVASVLLDTICSQCHWLALEFGQTVGEEQTVFHVCMVLQDTMEGCLTAFVVLYVLTNTLTTCTACNAGKYKLALGFFECSACPAKAQSPIRSPASTSCQCNTGYTCPNCEV